MAKALTWFATSAIPLTLLFVIDISFVRYQSQTITWILHFIFFCDLGLVVLFHWEVFGQRVVKIPRRIGTWAKGLVASGMVLVLIFAAHPPGEDGSPWSNRTYGKPINFKELFGTFSDLHKLLDVGPCKAWKIGCRYLNVSNLDTKNEKLWLNGRTLQFARFKSAQLKGVNFQGAQLQGADFQDAELQGAIFRDAKLRGADFRKAKLQGADFTGQTQLQGADLQDAELQGAIFRDAKLRGADLRKAKLQGAIFDSAQLQGANLRRAQLQGANLILRNCRGRISNQRSCRGRISVLRNCRGRISIQRSCRGRFS